MFTNWNHYQINCLIRCKCEIQVLSFTRRKDNSFLFLLFRIFWHTIKWIAFFAASVRDIYYASHEERTTDFCFFCLGFSGKQIHYHLESSQFTNFESLSNWMSVFQPVREELFSTSHEERITDFCYFCLESSDRQFHYPLESSQF